MSIKNSVACRAIDTFINDPVYGHFHYMLSYYVGLNHINQVIDDASFGRHLNKKGLQEFSDHYWDKYQIHFERDNRLDPNRYGRNKANWPNWISRIRDEFVDTIPQADPQTFPELFEVVNNIVQSPNCLGFGHLYAYDVSLRVGAFLELDPDAVYIHAGAKKGLEKLYGVSLSNDLEFRTISKQEFVDNNSCFDRLSCKEIECFLCVAHVNGWI